MYHGLASGHGHHTIVPAKSIHISVCFIAVKRPPENEETLGRLKEQRPPWPRLRHQVATFYHFASGRVGQFDRLKKEVAAITGLHAFNYTLPLEIHSALMPCILVWAMHSLEGMKMEQGES